MLFVASNIVICTCATCYSDWHPVTAKVLLLLYLGISVNDGLTLASVPIIRYLLVFHGTLFYTTSDDVVMNITKTTNAILSIIIVVFDMFTSDRENFYHFVVMTNPVKLGSDDIIYNPNSVQFAFSLAILAFTILQIRLEILNYKYGEGFVVQLKKWWKNTHQDEISENEEWGINFQRIMISMLAIMTIFFFAGTNEFLQTQTFFGLTGRVSTSVLIQIIVVDLLWTMVIIQHPLARKRLVHMITCTSETVQIVRF